MAQASLYQTLKTHLTVLKLDACAEALPRVLDEAAAEQLSVTATLERLLAIEVDTAQARRLVGRLRFACLPTPATLDDYDFDAQPGVDRALINELGTCRYIETATNVLLDRPARRRQDPPRRRPRPPSRHRRLPHLLHHRGGPRRPLPPRRHRRTLGHHHALLRRTHPARHRRTRLPPTPRRSRSALFQVVSQRYLKTSIVITTNRGVAGWGEILGDTTVAAAMLDRLLHRSVVLNLDGDSYRLRDHHARTDTLRRTTTGTRNPLP